MGIESVMITSFDNKNTIPEEALEVRIVDDVVFLSICEYKSDWESYTVDRVKQFGVNLERLKDALEVLEISDNSRPEPHINLSKEPHA